MTATPVKFARILTKEGQSLYFDDIKLRLIAGLLKAGRPVALIGEPGSGKSELGRAILHKALEAHEKANPGAVTHFHQQEFAGIVSGDMLDGKLFAA